MSSPSYRQARISDATFLGHIQVTSWRSAFRGIAPDDYLDHQVSPENQAQDWKDILTDKDQIVVVAELGNELAGYAWAHREDDPAMGWDTELVSMHILPSFKRQGIGKGLIASIASELLSRNYRSMYLWVLEDNRPARAFYELIGGAVVGKHQIELGGKDLIEVAYAWDDITALGRPGDPAE